MSIKPFIPALPPKIAIVGEAPGETEEMMGFPFMGASGQELTRMLQEAGIVRDDCYITNVFLERPENNDLSTWCVSKRDATKLWRDIGNKGEYPYKALTKAKYLEPRFLGARDRLFAELNSLDLNVIIALGNTACWALLDTTGISGLRGTVCSSKHTKAKVLPTYHPAAVVRQWDLRAVTIADLMKGKRESGFKEIRKPKMEIWTYPTLDDIEKFEATHIAGASHISFDIETSHGEITCIGFGTGSAALVIPFFDPRQKGNSYWPSQEQEVSAWLAVKRILQNEKIKVAQNGLYDIQYLWRLMGIYPKNYRADTMALHHSLFPELPKGLGFLGSVYTDYPSWKSMRPKGQQINKLEE